jgi:putative oxidoreductase
MSYGILFIRVVVGLVLVPHGAQKLFGWFGGHGLRGTASFFGGLGFRAPLSMALAAGLAEFGGGLLFAAGLLTPIAALLIAVTMLTAIWTVHWRKGFWNTAGGYEYNLVIWSTAVGIAATGGGRYSLDAVLGWADDLRGLRWGLAVLAASVLCAALSVLLGRRRHGGSAGAAVGSSGEHHAMPASQRRKDWTPSAHLSLGLSRSRRAAGVARKNA